MKIFSSSSELHFYSNITTLFKSWGHIFFSSIGVIWLLKLQLCYKKHKSNPTGKPGVNSFLRVNPLLEVFTWWRTARKWSASVPSEHFIQGDVLQKISFWSNNKGWYKPTRSASTYCCSEEDSTVFILCNTIPSHSRQIFAECSNGISITFHRKECQVFTCPYHQRVVCSFPWT